MPTIIEAKCSNSNVLDVLNRGYEDNTESNPNVETVKFSGITLKKHITFKINDFSDNVSKHYDLVDKDEYIHAKHNYDYLYKLTHTSNREKIVLGMFTNDKNVYKHITKELKPSWYGLLNHNVYILYYHSGAIRLIANCMYDSVLISNLSYGCEEMNNIQLDGKLRHVRTQCASYSDIIKFCHSDNNIYYVDLEKRIIFSDYIINNNKTSELIYIKSSSVNNFLHKINRYKLFTNLKFYNSGSFGKYTSSGFHSYDYSKSPSHSSNEMIYYIGKK